MKSNQSLHLTIKQPPNPEPVRTIGVFADLDNPELPNIIKAFVTGTNFVPKDKDFEGNVRDELLKLLASGAKVLTVERHGKIVTVHLQEQ